MPDHKISLYFITGKDKLVSAIIRGGCMGFPASHVGAILPDGRWISAHAGDGVQYRTEADESPWAYYALVTIPCSKEQSDAHTTWLTGQIGRKYDMAAIAAMAEGMVTGMNRAEGWTGEWICSTLQLEALAHPDVGFFKWRPANLRTTTPRDLMWGCSNIADSTLTFRGDT